MKYYELAGETDGIFNVMNKIETLKFLDDDIMTPENADNAFTFLNGNKELIGAIKFLINRKDVDEAMEIVAKNILFIYRDKWEDLYRSFQEEYPIKEQETITEDIEDKGNENTTSDLENKVSAYDEDELLTESGNKQSGNTDNENTRTRSLNKETTNGEAIEKNIFRLQKEVFYDIIFVDINSMIFGSIY